MHQMLVSWCVFVQREDRCSEWIGKGFSITAGGFVGKENANSPKSGQSGLGADSRWGMRLRAVIDRAYKGEILIVGAVYDRAKPLIWQRENPNGVIPLRIDSRSREKTLRDRT